MSAAPGPYASANGQRIATGSLSIPYWGRACADVALAIGGGLTPAVALALGNLSLASHVYRQRDFAGTTTARLMGGGGGWGKPVPAKGYANPAGILLATVLGDVAREVGETVNLLGSNRTARIGQFFAREAGPAQRVLRQLVGLAWWIDVAGVTQNGPRPSVEIKSPATVETYHGSKGWLTVASEDLASWLPGATFSSATVPQAFTISAVRHEFDNAGKLRTEILTT